MTPDTGFLPTTPFQSSPDPEKAEGLPSTICRRCGQGLSNETSIKHGYGPVCYKKRMAGDLRTSKLILKYEPRTITDKGYAAKTIAAIYRLINNLADSDLAHGRWLTGEDIKTLPLESFDTDEGITLPGFGKPQWFYLHCDKYDLAIWKVRISNQMIMDEMEAHGDIPKEWTRED